MNREGVGGIHWEVNLMDLVEIHLLAKSNFGL